MRVQCIEPDLIWCSQGNVFIMKLYSLITNFDLMHWNTLIIHKYMEDIELIRILLYLVESNQWNIAHLFEMTIAPPSGTQTHVLALSDLMLSPVDWPRFSQACSFSANLYKIQNTMDHMYTHVQITMLIIQSSEHKERYTIWKLDYSTSFSSSIVMSSSFAFAILSSFFFSPSTSSFNRLQFSLFSLSSAET